MESAGKAPKPSSTNNQSILEQKPPLSFTAFQRLPAEIRYDIWRMARPIAAFQPGVCVLALDDRNGPWHLIVRNSLSAVAAVNTEARHIASGYSPARDYKPETDTLYVNESAVRAFTRNICRDEPWVAEIRHVALAFAVSDHGQYLPTVVGGLKKLETLSIVYPGTKGAVHFRCPVGVPIEGRLTLRKLARRELNGGLKIQTRYLVSTWAGDFHITWTQTVKKHIRSIEETLNIGGPVNGAQLPTWDGEKKHRPFKIEAVCFA